MYEIERTPGNARGRCRIVAHGGLVWTVATGPGANVAEQTKATLSQLEANLEEAGAGKASIVDATVYLADMETKAEMDAVWCAWIPTDGWPCRACIGTDLASGDLVEIKVTAVR
jgi:enamine deaminase RidA (YjgF/YER057c/UK114 family)